MAEVKCLTIALVGWLLTIAPNATAEPSRIESENLRGVGPINIAISPLPQWAEEGGLDRQELKERVTHTLYDAGIPISPAPTDKGATLSIVVSGASVPIPTKYGEKNAYYFTASVSVLQKVRMLTDDRRSIASTWNYEKAGITSAADVSAIRINDSIDAIVHRLTLDYYSVNPSNQNATHIPN